MRPILSLSELVTRIVDELDEGTLRVGFREAIQRGSATGHVELIDNLEDPAQPILVVQLGVLRLPEGDRPDLMRRLLELNATFRGRAAFAIAADRTVVLTAGRPVQDLDPDEVIDLILWTSEQADHFDDVLLSEFGAELAL